MGASYVRLGWSKSPTKARPKENHVLCKDGREHRLGSSGFWWKNKAEGKEARLWASLFFRIGLISFTGACKWDQQGRTSADRFPAEAHKGCCIQLRNDLLKGEWGIPWAYSRDLPESPEKCIKLMGYWPVWLIKWYRENFSHWFLWQIRSPVRKLKVRRRQVVLWFLFNF